jgi:hypothetical protein
MTHDDRDRPEELGAVGGDRFLDAARRGYHVPPEPPREAMWAVIRAGLSDEGLLAEQKSDGVIPLRPARSRAPVRPLRRGVPRWAWGAAAAAVLALGIGLGRWSVPAGVPGPVAETDPAVGSVVDDGSALELAARMHFGRSESLLTALRSDALGGRMDASVGPWARSLLAQTRLLMDARGGRQDDTQRLLSDLELALVQIVGASQGGALDDERAREEMDLAVRSLERGELLNRIRSAVPNTMSGA